MPARKPIYLRPLQRLHHRCTADSVSDVGTAVETLAIELAADRLIPAPRAGAAAVLAADVGRSMSCYALAKKLARELDRPAVSGHHEWHGQTLALHFAPTLTAPLALALIRHSLLPGKVHVVYSLRAAECQQTIYMGRKVGVLIGNPYLGAFVELSSGRGVGKTKYDASRVDHARITQLGAIGGEPCT